MWNEAPDGTRGGARFALAAAAVCLAGAAAGQAAVETVAVETVAVETGGGALNLRAEPSAEARIVAQVPDGAILRGGLCRVAAGMRWCRVATLDGALEAWAAGDLLRAADAPAAAPAPAIAAPAGTRVERLAFGEGAARALMTGSLAAGEAREYVVPVRAGQTLEVRLPRRDAGLRFAVRAPDGRVLFDPAAPGEAFVGVVPTGGEAVVVVTNDGAVPAGYDIDLALR